LSQSLTIIGAKMDIYLIAKEVFEVEAKEILNLSKNLTADFKGAIYSI